jgi:hypothetical protein
MVFTATAAFADHERVVFDNHAGRPGGTGKRRTFDLGDPRYQVEPPGKCGEPFLGGTAFGHPDPRFKDPKAVCGHGIVFILTKPHEGRRPLLILPISTTPVAPGQGARQAIAVDPARLVREHLPRLDAVSGDGIPVIVELRNAIRSLDVARALKHLPRPILEPDLD